MSILDKFKSEYTSSKAVNSAVTAFAGGIGIALSDSKVTEPELIHALVLGALTFTVAWGTKNKKIVQDIVDVVDPPAPVDPIPGYALTPPIVATPDPIAVATTPNIIIPPGTGI